ncbi:dTDP-4-dehydrorhamnose reductase [Chloroflexi bacterium TSY]|nr:dTDP-4-dehydrorhamnose reductase [Chloroflexi bacterium TSY]
MHVLIIGGRGQLGMAIQKLLSQRANSTNSGDKPELTVWSRPDYDIINPAIVKQLVSLQANVVINAAAWTDVDGAESSPDAAYATNALGPLHLAQGCAQCSACLVHVSTNEVFAGDPGRFYYEYDLPAPTSVYARSKLAGERAARQLLDKLYIVRVAWFFGPGGNNFPSKIMAAADKHGALRVVDDEIGNPTYAPDAAAAIAQLIQTERYGIYHIVNDGYASRFSFAKEILQQSGRGHIPLTPIPSSEWPRPAPPPLHALLVNSAAASLGIKLRPWQEALSDYLSS